MSTNTKALSSLELVCLKQDLEIRTWKEHARKASKILQHLVADYMEDECCCNFKDEYHCLPCRISDWQNRYEKLRKTK